jgi:hypothetical protein
MLQKFTSRKFILALIGQIVGLLVLFYPEHADSITAAATNVGALVLMALSGYGFIQGEAMIDAARITGDSELDIAVANKLPNKIAAANPDQGDRGPTSPLLLMPLLLGLGLAAGCALTPTARYAQGVRALDTATALAIQASPRLSDEQIVTTDTAIRSARSALGVAKSQLPDGGTTFEDYMLIVDAVLDTVIQALQTSVTNTPDVPGTPPGPGSMEMHDGPSNSPRPDRGREGDHQRSREASAARPGGGLDHGRTTRADRGRSQAHGGPMGRDRVGRQATDRRSDCFRGRWMSLQRAA